MSGIETNNVVERLIEAALILRAKGYSEHADAADQAASTAQSLSDRIDVLEGENRQLKIDRLTILAMVYHIAPATVAKMCDEQLDRSGALLGEVREIDQRASLTQGGKTNG